MKCESIESSWYNVLFFEKTRDYGSYFTGEYQFSIRVYMSIYVCECTCVGVSVCKGALGMRWSCALVCTTSMECGEICIFRKISKYVIKNGLKDQGKSL